MKDFSERKLLMLVAGAVLLIALIVAISIDPPWSFIGQVTLVGETPTSIERKAERLPGLSRFGSDYRAIRREIRDSAYLESADFDFSGRDLTITFTPSEDMVALTDGNDYVLYGENVTVKPSSMDYAFIRMHMPLVQVSSGQLEYIERFGIEKRLSEVIDLILEIYHSSSYNDKLVGKVKYQSGTGEEFGHLSVISASGDAVLHIREKAEAETILKSLSVMKENGKVLPTTEMREYELRGNTLTEQKRIVDGI